MPPRFRRTPDPSDADDEPEPTDCDASDSSDRSERSRHAAYADPGEQGIELSASDLSPEALRGLVEEFVSREGTDYGHADRSLESKVAAVMRQLEAGEARIVFDLESETASIVTTRTLRAR